MRPMILEICQKRARRAESGNLFNLLGRKSFRVMSWYLTDENKSKHCPKGIIKTGSLLFSLHDIGLGQNVPTSKIHYLAWNKPFVYGSHGGSLFCSSQIFSWFPQESSWDELDPILWVELSFCRNEIWSCKSNSIPVEISEPPSLPCFCCPYTVLYCQSSQSCPFCL